MGVGVTGEDARNCDITGCYEFSPRGKSNGTGAGHVNMLKPFELIFNDGVDPDTGIDLGCRTGDITELKTFDDFYAAYLKQLGHIIETIIACSRDYEPYLSTISPAQVFSATVENSLETARDAFQDGAVYNFSSVLNVGFATAVDALMAVKRFVYEREMLTLTELRNVLRDNWQGHEKLRLRVLHDGYKYGNGIAEVDFYAEALARFVGNKITMRPNARGGIYLASLHTARQYINLGEKTGATPDGRLAGEEMSKNASPTMGMDVQGLTALIKSVTRIDSALFPGDFPLDVMVHPATVTGEEGLAAMRTLVQTYMDKGGIAIHFNVFDADTLIKAQEQPDRYQGLQVRVCGWNVNFTELSLKEQDMYIRRAQSIAE
jgi:formate C-acetyltransferase